ncbi:MAG: RodZ domain-containing protein [Cyanobacteria bacterium P01_A01_bin.45]
MKWFRRTKNESVLSVEGQPHEKLVELGSNLRTVREERGLSIDEVVVLTRIPRRLLVAIEEGLMDELPEPIYTKGLIREFANALGFNGVEFASTFPVQSPKITLSQAGQFKPVGQLRAIHLYLLYILIIFTSVTSLSSLLSESSTVADATSETPNKSTPKTQQVEIGITLKERSRIKVIADGKTKFDGVLPEGTSRTWKAQKELKVKTDNAGGVLVSVNQQKAKTMGKPGAEEEVRVAIQP